MPVASELLVKIGADVSGLNKGLGEADSKVQSFASGASALGGVATAAFAGLGVAAIGLGAGIGSAISTASDFETAMSAVAAVADGGEASLAALSATALQLGQDTTLSGVGATDAARAMRELAAAGISVDDIIGGAALGALRLASAGGLDVARAAEIASNAMAGFGLAGSEATRVADLFAAAANASSIDVNDIGESMKYVAPIAKAMGLSIEDVTAALASLGNQGIKSSQAGTSLRSMISSLSKPSKEAQKAMNELGLSFFDSSGKMKSLGGISGELQTKLAGLTDQQRAATLVTLFGQEALSAATILYGEGADGIAEWTQKLLTGTTAAEAGAIRNNNLKGSIEALGGAWETAKIVLGQAFTPALKTMTDALADGVSAAIPFIQAFGPRLAAALSAGVAAALSFGTGVAGAISAVVGAFRALFSGQITFAQFVGGMENFVAAVAGKLGELATRAAPHLAAFGSAIFSFIASAVPQIVAQMGQWAGAFTGWIAGTAIPALQTALPQWLAALSTWATGTALPAITSFMGALGGAFGGWLTSAITALQATLPQWLGALSTWATGTAIPAVTGYMATLGTAFSAWITGTAIPALQTDLPRWLAAIGTWVTGTAVPGITAALAAVGTAFGDWVGTTAVPWVTTTLPNWLAAIGAWITGTAIPGVRTALTTLGTEFGNWVGTVAVPFVTSTLPLWGTAISTWITGTAIPQAQTALTELGKAMADWITNTAVPGVQTNMPAWSDAVVQGIQDTQNRVNAPLEDLAHQMGEDFGKALVTHGVPAITSAIGEHWTEAFKLALLTSPPVAIREAGNLLARALGEWVLNPGIPEVVKNFAQWEAQVAMTIMRMVAPFQAIMFQLGAGIAQGLIEGLVSLLPSWAQSWEAFKTAASQALDNLIIALATSMSQMGTNISGGMGNILGQWVTSWATMAATVGAQLGTMVGQAAAAIGQLAGTIIGGLGSIAGQAAAQAAAIGGAIISGIAGAISAGAGQLASIASSVVQGALDAAKNALGIHSPSKEFAEVGRMAIQGLILGMDAKADEAAKKSAEIAKSVADAAVSVLAAMRAIARFDFAADTPSAGQIGGLVGFLGDLLSAIQGVAASYAKEGLESANRFADAAGKAAGVVKSGIDALIALGKGYAAPGIEAIQRFAGDVGNIVHAIQGVASSFGAAGLDATAAFADAAGKALGIVGNGVAALKALGAEYEAPTLAAIQRFAGLVGTVVHTLQGVAAAFKDEALAHASAFAETAGKAVGIIGNGVSGLAQLADVQAVGLGAIQTFAGSVGNIVAALVGVGQAFAERGLSAASAFADTAGKALGIIGSAVEGLMKLPEFVAPSAAAIDRFVYAVQYFVQKLGQMAGIVGADAVARANEMGTAAKSVFDAAKAALDVFAGFKDLVVPSAAAIDALAIGMQYVVNRLGQIAADIGTKGLAQAQSFATVADKVFASLKNAMQVLTDLSKFKDNAKIAFDALLGGMQDAVERAQAMVVLAKGLQLEAEEYLLHMEAAARAFAKGAAMQGIGGGAGPAGAGKALGEAVAQGARDALDSHSPSQVMAAIGRDVVAGLVQGMDADQQDAAKKAADVASAVAGAIQDTLASLRALAGFNGAHAPSGDQIAGVLDFTRRLVGEMGAAAATLSAEGLAATDAYAKAAGSVADAFAKAGDMLGKVRPYTAATQAAIYDVGKGLKAAINDLAVLAESVGADMLDLAASFADGAGKVADAVGKTGDAFGKLGDFAYTDAARAAIFALGKGIRQVVADFGAIADQLDSEAVAHAGVFAEAAGKVVDVVGKGVEGFAKLVDWKPVASGMMDSFVATVDYLVRGIARVAQGLTSEGLTLAGEFADAGSKAVGLLGSGIAGIAGLVNYVAPPKAALDSLLATIRYVVARFGEMATTLSEEGATQTGNFGDAASKALGAVKSGVDAFAVLDTINMPTNAKVDDLLRAVQYTTERVAAVAAGVGDEAIGKARAFGEAASAIFGALKSGLDLFIEIDKPGNWPATDWLQPLIELMGGVLSRGAQLVSQAEQLRQLAETYAATMGMARAGWAAALGGDLGGGMALPAAPAPVGLPAGAGGGATVVYENHFHYNDYSMTGADRSRMDAFVRQLGPALRRQGGIMVG